MTLATSQELRTDRAKRVIETHRRRKVLFQRAPTADPQWVEAITAADPLWGPEEDWKLLVDQTTMEAESPVSPPLAQIGNQKPTTHLAAPNQPNPLPTADNHEAELAALEADLHDLFHPSNPESARFAGDETGRAL